MSSAPPETTAEWQEPAAVQSALSGIAAQEKALQLSAFGNDVAAAIGDAIREILRNEHRGASALVSIRLWSGLTPFQLAVGPNVQQNNDEWVRRKTATVRSYGKSSFLVGRELVAKDRDINSLGAEFAAHGGAVPILISNVGPIGAVIVSGLAQWQDHHVVVKAIAQVKEQKGL